MKEMIVRRRGKIERIIERGRILEMGCVGRVQFEADETEV